MTEVLAFKRPGRGGARAGAGRKPGSPTKASGRFVYIIHELDEPSVCKIGLANNPFTRLSGHQVSTWRKLALSHAFTCANAVEAALVEKAVHSILSGVHVSGEWFRVSPSRAADEVTGVAGRCGVSIAPIDPSRDLKFIKPNSSDG